MNIADIMDSPSNRSIKRMHETFADLQAPLGTPPEDHSRDRTEDAVQGPGTVSAASRSNGTPQHLVGRIHQMKVEDKVQSGDDKSNMPFTPAPPQPSKPDEAYIK